MLKLLELPAPAWVGDAGIYKNGSVTTTLVTSNKEMLDTIKIVKYLEDSGVLLKGVTKTIKNETKEPRGGFLSMLLGAVGANLLLLLLLLLLLKV